MSTSKSSHGLESNCVSPNRLLDRRTFLHGAVAGAAMLAVPRWAYAEERNLNPVWQQIEKRHDESVQRLQQWIRQPSIAAENKGVNEGCELTMQFLRDAGFGATARVATARLAITGGDQGAIKTALEVFVAEQGALAWALRGR